MRNLFLLGLIILSTGCKAAPERLDFPLAQQREYGSWEDLFQDAQEMELQIWNTGSILSKTQGVINLEYPGAPQMDKKSWLPVPVYHVENNQGRSVLLDAGLDSQYSENPYAHVSGLFKYFVLPEGKAGHGSAAQRLSQQNMDLHWVLFTHSHFDHTAGVVELPQGVNYAVGKGEEPIEVPLLFRARHFDDVETLHEIDFSRGFTMPPFESVVDLFGDGSIFAIATTGHTSGHVSYLINAVGGAYLVAGDQVNIRENLDYSIPPGSYSADMGEAEESFFKILTFLDENPQVTLLMGHGID